MGSRGVRKLMPLDDLSACVEEELPDVLAFSEKSGLVVDVGRVSGSGRGPDRLHVRWRSGDFHVADYYPTSQRLVCGNVTKSVETAMAAAAEVVALLRGDEP